MEDLYEKIINHIILKLKNGEVKLSKIDIARELNITVREFDNVCAKKQMPEFLIELSKSSKARDWIKRITDDFNKLRSSEIGNNFVITRERIRQIEAKAMRLINKTRIDPPDDIA